MVNRICFETFCQACLKNRDVDFILEMIEQHGSSLVFKINDKKQTALMYACQNLFCPEIVDLLIEAGANVFHKDSFGKDALFYAKKSKNTIAEEILLDEMGNQYRIIKNAINSLNLTDLESLVLEAAYAKNSNLMKNYNSTSEKQTLESWIWINWVILQ